MEKDIGKKNIYHGSFLNLDVHRVILENGNEAERVVVSHLGAVAVVPVYNDEVILVQQYRFPLRDYLLEIPAGKLEKNEEPYDCAKRELLEETGCETENLKFIAKLATSPGFSNEIIYIYKAAVDRIGKSNPDEDEFVEMKKIKINEIKEYIKKGKIIDGKTIAALLMVFEEE